MDAQAIRDAITSDPALMALVPDTQAIADAMSQGRTVTGDVTAHDIRQYLMLVDLLLPIEESTSPTCKAATRALEIFPVFDLSNPMIAYKLGQVLDGLVADDLVPDFTEEHKLTILSLAQHPDPVSEFDVRKAIFADDGEVLV
jgi:hypothetical protein